MQNLQNSYNLIKEGKGNKELFIKQARREFPQYITNVQTFEQIVNRLKERNVISETKEIATTAEPNWFNIFNKNIQEAKAEEKKTTAEVTDIQAAGYDYSDEKAMDNVFGAEFLKGYYVEMKNPKNESKTEEQIKAIVAKNLTKDSLYYVKDGQFGVKELGYTETPTKEAKGKHKSSGYGDLTENILSFNKKKKAKSALSTHLQAAKSEKNKEGENEIKKAREQIMNAKSEDELISILDDFGYDKGEIDNISKEQKLRSVIRNIISEEMNEIGMFNDPIGYKKSESNPKDLIFTKKFVDTSDTPGHAGYIYDIYKNGIKIKTIEGEGNANAFINAEKRKLNEGKWNHDIAGSYGGSSGSYSRYIDGLQHVTFYLNKDTQRWEYSARLIGKDKAPGFSSYIEVNNVPEKYEEYFDEGNRRGMTTIAKKILNGSLNESETRSVGPMIKPTESTFKIGDLAKAEVSKNKMNEGYGMSLEDAKAEAQRVSDEEGVVQHVEETEEGSGKYKVSDWYDSDLTVASYEHGNLKENAETEHTVEEASRLQRLQKLIDEVLTTKK